MPVPRNSYHVSDWVLKTGCNKGVYVTTNCNRKESATDASNGLFENNPMENNDCVSERIAMICAICVKHITLNTMVCQCKPWAIENACADKESPAMSNPTQII